MTVGDSSPFGVRLAVGPDKFAPNSTALGVHANGLGLNPNARLTNIGDYRRAVDDYRAYDLIGCSRSAADMPRTIGSVAITPTDHVADGVHILFMPPAGDQVTACLIAANVLGFGLVPFHQHPGEMAFVVCLGGFLESFDGLRLPPIQCECLPR
jgi:hypothetical protein